MRCRVNFWGWRNRVVFQSQFKRSMYLSAAYRIVFDVIVVSGMVLLFRGTVENAVFAVLALWVFSILVGLKNFMFGLFVFFGLGGRRLQKKIFKNELNRLGVSLEGSEFVSPRQAIDEFVSDGQQPLDKRIAAARFAGSLDAIAAQGGLRTLCQSVALEDALETSSRRPVE
jgi:hypothetical protein